MTEEPLSEILEIDGRSQIISNELEEVKYIEFVILHHFDIGIDLTPLEKIENSFTLILEDCRLDVFSLGPISKSVMKSLIIKNCEFLNSTIDLSAFNRTKGQSTLRALHLLNDNLHHIDLIPLKNCKDLESLSITGNPNLTDIQLSPIMECHGLRTISLVENPRINTLDVTPLGPCTKLEVLDIQGTGIERVDITAIIHLFSSSNQNEWPQIKHDNNCQVTYNSFFQSLYNLPSDYIPIVTDGEITRELIVKQHILTREKIGSLRKFIVSPQFILGMSLSYFSQVMVQFMFQQQGFVIFFSVLGALSFVMATIMITKEQ